ncbi:MAG: LamG-like jellyroll fold domain-containing protein [Hydrogenoanaerobacterium sp.]
MYPDRYLCTKFVSGSSAESDSSIGLSLDGSCQFAIDAWVRVDSLQGNQEIISQTGTITFSMEQNYLSLELTGHKKVVGSGYPLLAGIWHYVCASYYEGYVSLYLDGEKICEKYAKNSPVTAETNGSNLFVMGRGLFGELRLVRVYNFSLTEGLIHESMFFSPADNYIQAAYNFSVCPPAASKSGKPITLRGGAKGISCTPAALCRNHAHIILPDLQQVNPGAWGKPFSVQLWANIHKDAEDRYLTMFSNVDSFHSAGFLIYAEKTSGAFHVKVEYGYFDRVPLVVTSTAVINSETWVNVAVTFSVDKLLLYLNGTNDCESAVTLPVIDGLAGRSMRIGADLAPEREGGEDWFSGSITGVDIWSKALNAEEVLKYCTARPDPTTSDLEASYDLNDDHWRSEVDQSAFTGVDNLAIVELRQDTVVGDCEVSAVLSANESFEAEPFSDDELLYFRREAGMTLESRGKRDAESYPFTVTHHEKSGRVYFVVHDDRASYTVTSVEAETENSDITLWWIELFLIIIGGVLSIVASVQLRHNMEVSKLIQNTLQRMPALTAMFNAAKTGAAMASVLISFIGILVKEGILLTLLKMTLSSGMWTLLWIVSKVFSKITFGAPLILVGLTALAVSVYEHIKQKPLTTPLPELNVSLLRLTGSSENGILSVPLRVNSEQIILSPEWNADRGDSQFAPALYCISDFTEGTVKKPIAIFAQFKSGSIVTQTLYVRAKETSGGIFGDSTVASVELKSGETRYVELLFSAHSITSSGIDKKQVTLSWQYSRDQKDWSNMLINTKLTIYIIPEQPKVPWGWQDADERVSRPWTAALDVYADALRGLKTTDAVAAAITKKVNEDPFLLYDKNSGASYFCCFYKPNNTKKHAFMLTRFFNRRVSCILNCTDCATIVTTFANLYGCSLTEIQMGPSKGGFDCNKIESIGYPGVWEKPFMGTGFSYHEVACRNTGNAIKQKLIYDACLKLNNSTTPWVDAGCVPCLPIGMAFSQNETAVIPTASPDNSYREHLASNTDGGIPNCLFIGSDAYSNGGRRPLVMDERRIVIQKNDIDTAVSERYGFSQWPAITQQVSEAQRKPLQFRAMFASLQNGGLSLIERRPFYAYPGGAEELYICETDERRWVRLTTIPLESAYEAQKALLAQLSENARYEVPRLKLGGADHVFGSIENGVIHVLFTVGHVFGQLSAMGFKQEQPLLTAVFQTISG